MQEKGQLVQRSKDDEQVQLGPNLPRSKADEQVHLSMLNIRSQAYKRYRRREYFLGPCLTLVYCGVGAFSIERLGEEPNNT